MGTGFWIFLFGTAALLLSWLSVRKASPVLAIFARWARWVLFALGGAYLLQLFGMDGRPFAVLAIMVFLGWFLLETIFNWLAIGALSRSEIPLFPRFVPNESGDEWPAHRSFLRLKTRLRELGFTREAAFKASLQETVVLRLSLYKSADGLDRLQILFLPQGSGNVTAAYALSSQTESGLRVTTDNIFLPFGGFYPEHWLLERSPWRRGLPALFQRHRKRREALNETFLPWEGDALQDLNAQQHELERVNTELGFLVPRPQQEEEGRLTRAGRIRVWEELWLLNYLGRARSY